MATNIFTIDRDAENTEPQNDPVPATTPFPPASVQPDKLKETLNRYAKERKQLVQQVTTSFREIDQLKAGLREERQTRQQLEEKLKDLMSAGMQYVRHELKGEPQSPRKEGRAVSKTQSQEGQSHASSEQDSAHQMELAEAERRVRDGVASLARATAELEKERVNRRRIEDRASSLTVQVETMHEQLRQHLESERANENKIAQLENDLRERESKVSQLQADLQNVTTDLRLAEERLNTTAEISRQFEDSLQVADEAKQAFKRTEEQLTACLEASAQALSEADGRLKKETSERQELAKTVESLQRQLQQETEKSKLEISRLQAALQVEKLERTQNEGKAVQTRYASIESARADRILLARLRTRTRGPMDELLRSTRRLLEDELDENRKKLVESMLEQALLLKSNFLEGADAIETSYTPVEA
jgi:hypothetical protein